MLIEAVCSTLDGERLTNRALIKNNGPKSVPRAAACEPRRNESQPVRSSARPDSRTNSSTAQMHGSAAGRHRRPDPRPAPAAAAPSLARLPSGGRQCVHNEPAARSSSANRTRQLSAVALARDRRAHARGERLRQCLLPWRTRRPPRARRGRASPNHWPTTDRSSPRSAKSLPGIVRQKP